MVRTTLAICLIVVSSALGGALLAADRPFPTTRLSSFLGSTATHQLSYLSGALDALFYASQHGVPPDHIQNCLFHETGGDPSDIFHYAPLIHAAKQVPEGQNEKISPVLPLMKWVEATCPIEKFGRTNSR